MPNADPLYRLGYLFDVLEDRRAPDDLKDRVRRYLYGPGFNDVIAALEPPSMTNEFKRLSDEARPHSQTGRVVNVLRALASAMPPTATIRQALALMVFAQGDFAGEPRRQADVKAGEPLSDSLYATTLSLAQWIEPVPGQNLNRDKPHRLTAEGKALVMEVLRVLRQPARDTDIDDMTALIEDDDVIAAVERYRNPA